MQRVKLNDFYFGMRENRKNCRLESVRLKNFKSVRDQEINLAPLTVLVGKTLQEKALSCSLFFSWVKMHPTHCAETSLKWGAWTLMVS